MFVSKVVLDPKSRKPGTYLEHEENCISDHAGERVWRGLDSVRRIELKLVNSKDALKKTKYLWPYSVENLPDKYRERYEGLKESDLKNCNDLCHKGEPQEFMELLHSV